MEQNNNKKPYLPAHPSDLNHVTLLVRSTQRDFLSFHYQNITEEGTKSYICCPIYLPSGIKKFQVY